MCWRSRCRKSAQGEADPDRGPTEADLFYSESDGGTKLFLGKGLAVNNDGGHAMVEESGKVSLAEGLYPIRVKYFEGGGGEGLKVSYEGPGIEKRATPASALFSDK